MVPYLRMETLKTLSYQVAQTYLVHVWECTPWVSKFKGENNVNMRVSFQIWIQLITITFHYNVQTEACFVLLTFMTEIWKMFSSQITTNELHLFCPKLNLPTIILPGSKLISPLRNNIPQHYTTRLIRHVFQLSLDSVAAIAKKGPVIWMVNHLNDPSDLNNHISNTRRHKTDIP